MKRIYYLIDRKYIREGKNEVVGEIGVIINGIGIDIKVVEMVRKYIGRWEYNNIIRYKRKKTKRRLMDRPMSLRLYLVKIYDSIDSIPKEEIIRLVSGIVGDDVAERFANYIMQAKTFIKCMGLGIVFKIPKLC